VDYDMTAALLDKNSGSPIWESRLDRQTHDGAFAADVNAAGDVVLGGCTNSDAGKKCAGYGGQTFAVVKLFGDADGDAVTNDLDNCLAGENSEQIDSDHDGYGNACDADYNDDGMVGTPDWAAFARAFGATEGSPDYDPKLDANGDGVIGTAELALLGSSFGQPLGPSGLACAGIAPCP
jgi:hypothetical protein